MDSNTRQIRREVFMELLRIAGFVVYYIILILLGMGIFVGVFFVSKFLVLEAIPEVGSARVIILLLLVILAMWTVAAMFAVYLIKPLFSFTKNSKRTRVEVTREDCPELFDMVSELASQVGCKMPKHVYLTPEVNACVFYNTSFWSIFFPVRKNLEIGLGLFDGMSVEEVKSVLAHEFGHFSQKSMKVGSTVYVTNSILYNITYGVDFWDGLLDKMTLSDHQVWRIAGGITRAFTNGIGKINAWLYGRVQKGYMKLSRQMEYDADNISCSIVGSDVFKSAMCKIETLSYKDATYRNLLNDMVGNNQIVEDYFVGRAVSDELNDFKGHPVLSYDRMLDSLVRSAGAPSKVKVDNMWSSHPSTEDRLANADRSPASDLRTSPAPAWSLISDAVRDKVSSNLIRLYKEAYPEIETLAEDGVRAYIQNYLANCMPEKMRPFFDRDILLFDIEEATDALSANPEMDINPFTDENLATLEEYRTAIRDYETLRAVMSGQIEAKEIMYQGESYSKHALPLKRHEEYLNELVERVRAIDRTMCMYVMRVVPPSTIGAILDMYVAIFYANDFNRKCSEIMVAKENLIAELNLPIRRNEEEYNLLVGEVNSFDRRLNKLIEENCSGKYMSVVLDEEHIKQINDYLAEGQHGMAGSIDVEELKRVFSMADYLADIHSRIEGVAKKAICEQALYLRPFVGLPQVAESAVAITSQAFENDEIIVKALAIDFQPEQTVVFLSFKGKDNGKLFHSTGLSFLEDDKGRQFGIQNSTIPFGPQKAMAEDTEEYIYAESYPSIPEDAATLSLKVGEVCLFKDIDVRSIRLDKENTDNIKTQ